MYAYPHLGLYRETKPNLDCSYLVTDLMSTDLHTLLRSKKVDNQFSQYFMYQIMVTNILPHLSLNYR